MSLLLVTVKNKRVCNSTGSAAIGVQGDRTVQRWHRERYRALHCISARILTHAPLLCCCALLHSALCAALCYSVCNLLHHCNWLYSYTRHSDSDNATQRLSEPALASTSGHTLHVCNCVNGRYAAHSLFPTLLHSPYTSQLCVLLIDARAVSYVIRQ